MYPLTSARSSSPTTRVETRQVCHIPPGGPLTRGIVLPVYPIAGQGLIDATSSLPTKSEQQPLPQPQPKTPLLERRYNSDGTAVGPSYWDPECVGEDGVCPAPDGECSPYIQPCIGCGCLTATIDVEWTPSCVPPPSSIAAVPAVNGGVFDLTIPIFYLKRYNVIPQGPKFTAIVGVIPLGGDTLGDGGDLLQFNARVMANASATTVSYEGTVTVQNNTPSVVTLDTMEVTLFYTAPGNTAVVQLYGNVVSLTAPLIVQPGQQAQVCLEDVCGTSFVVDTSLIPEGSLLQIVASLSDSSDTTLVSALSESFELPSCGDDTSIAVTSTVQGLLPENTYVDGLGNGQQSTVWGYQGVIYGPFPAIDPQDPNEVTGTMEWSTTYCPGGTFVPPGSSGPHIGAQVKNFTLEVQIYPDDSEEVGGYAISLKHVGTGPYYARAYTITYPGGSSVDVVVDVDNNPLVVLVGASIPNGTIIVSTNPANPIPQYNPPVIV